jgi:hypothetical protein
MREPITDIILSVDLGRCKTSAAGNVSTEVDFRETHRVKLTTEFSVDRHRDYLHIMLDLMLDKLSDRIDDA